MKLSESSTISQVVTDKYPAFGDIHHQPFAMYVGTKSLAATPMNLGTYNSMREFQMPQNEDPNKAGYLVVYEDGYVSWSPSDVFEESYARDGFFTFGMALHLALTTNTRIARKGWNGAGQYVLRINGSALAVGIHQNYGDPTGDTNPVVSDALFLVNAQNKMFPWLPSQGDLLATDWCIVI